MRIFAGRGHKAVSSDSPCPEMGVHKNESHGKQPGLVRLLHHKSHCTSFVGLSAEKSWALAGSHVHR